MTASAAVLADTDLALAARCAARDPAALRQLVTAHNQTLFRAAWSILKSHAEAQDAVQAAYVHAIVRIDAFEGRSTLSTWLTRIVINEALGRLRADRRRKARLEAEGIAMIEPRLEQARAAAPAQPDAAVAREQIRQLIERAVAGLPTAFRAVFVLRDVEGLSVEETARALDIPAATVKTRLLRARRRLQDALQPEVRSALVGAFPVAGQDCAALTERVLAALQKG
jgi:RNA polymerase sigma-70 factor (ECF subfamily)